ETIDKLLEHTVTPGIAVPENFQITGKEMNVLIAFDGSLPAARALRQFGRRMDPEICTIRIINAGNNMEKCNHVLDRAENYLAAHNFKKIEKIYTPGKIINVIDDKYHDWADLIVVGLHSKKGFFDKFIGSLCRHLIQRADTSLFFGA
ncbi:MAG: universal stress protein, partial [bacterium]|nr:universal stress protein [bacterium]